MKGDTSQKSEEHQSQSPAGQWQYTPEEGAQPQISPLAPLSPEQPAHPPVAPIEQDVTWTASEFVAHNKGFNWYALLLLAAAALATAIWFLTGDFISVGVIIVVAILLGIAATRKPRVLEYHLDSDGLEIAGKFYPYSEFRSFSVMQEGAFSSIMLVPMRRFAPPISIYYAPEDEDEIIDVISLHLPHEERQHDLIDRFARRIRF